MGWTFQHGQSRADLIRELVSDCDLTAGGYTYGRRTCLRHACVGNHLWAVFENSAKSGGTKPDRYLMLFKLERWRGDWGYKDVDEAMGFIDYTCPRTVFDLIRDTEPSGYAAEWRKSMELRYQLKKMKLHEGSIYYWGDDRVRYAGFSQRGMPVVRVMDGGDRQWAGRLVRIRKEGMRPCPHAG